MIAFNRVLDAFREQGLIVQERGANRANAQAPGHSASDRSVTITDIGEQVLVHSHSDDTETVLEALGLEMKDLFDSERGVEYKYSDGRTKHRSTEKKFWQSGNLEGNALYRVERVAEATTVFFAEGEKDVHALEALDLVAVSTAGGAGNAHKSDVTPLFGKKVIIVRDLDDAGEKHAIQLMDMLGTYCDVSVVQPKVGKDAADHVAAGYDVQDFEPDKGFTKRAMVAAFKRELEALDEMSETEALAHLYNTLDRHRPDTDEAAFYTFDDTMAEWWNWLDDDSANRVIPLPWQVLNETFNGGAHRKRSILFAGRPGEGKSISLTNIAVHAAKLGFKVAVFSLEMDRIEIMSRLIAAGANAEYGQITRREIDETNMMKIAQFTDDTTGAKVWISDRAGLTIEQVIAECRQLNAQHDIDLFLFDYVQLLKSEGNVKREEALERISQGIRYIAKTCDAASISAAQLNRENTKESRPPVPSDLRGSGSLEQDADAIVLIHHEKFNGQPTGDVEFIVGKNRVGPIRTHTMEWRPYRATIS